ncbi:hypothetical protein [Neomegalonema sp.]|uniref:hypothetical protein n=1 Tax=Neomegalonema sp. TaxID=2039713 RepID=UPI00260DAAA7|nr:hypothetical protein [Neomegalonema sp.]MDD2869304.1 hypothetical protein [Neomegalonema sp.]
MFAKLLKLRLHAPLVLGAALWSAAANAQEAGGGILQRVQGMEARIVALSGQLAEKDEQIRRQEAALAALGARVEQETARIRVAPSQKRHSGYSAARGGGSNAITMVANCNADEVVVGVELIVGGTCKRQCDADGGALHKFRLVCGPRFQ